MIAQFNLIVNRVKFTLRRSEKWDYTRKEWVPSFTCTNRNAGTTVVVTEAYYMTALGKFKEELEKTKLPKL